MNDGSQNTFKVGDWAFSPAHGESVRILDVETVWDRCVYQVWVPRLGTVERVPAESLSEAQVEKPISLDKIIYTVAAAKIADALTQDVLLAPLEAGVIPLPHQLHALTRAVTGDRVRFLLADEVGLGKTINQKRQYLGFLMILMQRLVTSSTYAIASALEKRLDALQEIPLTPTLSPEDGGEGAEDFGAADRDSQEQLDELLARRLTGLQNEKEEVTLLLELARRCQAQGTDARAETLLETLYTFES